MELPNNFENILLKELISDKVFFNKAKTILKPKIFSSISNNKIYSIIENYYNDYKEVPTLQEIILQARNLPNAELKSQIATSLQEITKAPSVNKAFLDDYTVKFVKDQLFEEALMEGANFIDRKDENSKIKAKNLIDESQKITMVADLGDKFSDFEPRLDYYQNPEKGLKYKRFQSFNKYLGGGILPGTLNVFLAPPGIGKSMLISYTIGDFLLQGKNILLVSMEMSNFEFMKRIDSDLTDIPIRDMGDKARTTEFTEKMKGLQLGELYVQNYPPNSFSAYGLEALLDMYKSHDISIDLVFLDYLGLMKSDLVSPMAGLYSYLKSIGEEVRAVAKLWNIPIFTASQLNRGSVNKDSKEVDNSMISDSLGTAMTADLMVMLIQTEAQKEKSEITFKITKNRYTGITKEFKVNVDYAKMRFSDIQLPEDVDIPTITEAPKLTSVPTMQELPWNTKEPETSKLPMSLDDLIKDVSSKM